MSDKKIKLKECIVAFIDILGSSDAISEDAQGSLDMMHNAYEETIKGFNELFTEKNIQPKVKIFSDNIVVAVPCFGSLKPVAFLAVAMMSAIIQVQFLKYGLLTRGGIASGSHFSDDIMVWGTALLKAHNIESTIAIYPRIIVESDLIADLDLTNPNNKTHGKEWIRQDNDCLFFIDCFNPYLKNRFPFILKLTDAVEKQIINLIDNTKKCQKWLWFNNYLNEKLLEL